MNKHFRFLICLGILTAQLASVNTVFATETSAETTESTLSSMSDDPLKEIKDRTGVSTNGLTAEKESEANEKNEESEASQTAANNDEKTTTDSTSDIQLIDGPAANPLSTTLIEGVDIDADFAKVLREDEFAVNGSDPWSGYGKDANELTYEDMTSINQMSIPSKNLTSLAGIEYAENLIELISNGNSIVEIDLTNNIALTYLNLAGNKLTEININKNTALTYLNICENGLTEINISKNTALTYLNLGGNKLTEIDLTTNIALEWLNMDDNKLDRIDLTNNTALVNLEINANRLTEIDLTKNRLLLYLSIFQNELTEIDITKNVRLSHLYIFNNELTEIDLTKNIELRYLLIQSNKLGELDISKNTALTMLDCAYNVLTELDARECTSLSELAMSDNQISKLLIPTSGSLTNLNANNNMIYDITPLNGHPNLYFTLDNQFITIPIPEVNNRKSVIQKLKTTAGLGLTVTNGTLLETPNINITTNGDDIELDNVTFDSFNNKTLNFSYTANQLIEGIGGGIFNGFLYFPKASVLEMTLQPERNKVNSGSDINWTWKITKKDSGDILDNIHAELSLPNGLTIDPSSIKINGNNATLNDINGINNLGNSGMTITFTTVATGQADQWLEPSARLTWTDDSINSPYERTITGDGIQILDDEQTNEPLSSELTLLSVPLSFRYGVQKISDTARSLNLSSTSYQTNTNVVTDGFYVRLADDRLTNTGWKLTAQLSDFKDSSNNLMPNSVGTSLRMEDMSIESITDRDTSQEAIDSSPVNSPSSVVSDTEIVAGQSAVSLISAEPNEGSGTWQLRLPFNKISLKLPAKAGKKSENYNATLTWSLDDTP
jgi:hypothetical protein